MLAPIALFVYNRLWHTQQTVEALLKNDLASESILYIFADGPKSNASQEQLEKIIQVREYIHQIKGFKEIFIIESERNKGLADSIVEGVTQVVNKNGKIVVLEDDIVTEKGFLRYMNDALALYQDEDKVMHVSGYMYPYKRSILPSTFFCRIPTPWGWGTWKRSWEHYNSDEKFLWEYYNNQNRWNEFNTIGGTWLQDQLEDILNGWTNTWFVKWHASILMKGGLSLFPRKSMVKNVGMDGSGVHCGKMSLYDGKCLSYIRVTKKNVKINNCAARQIIKFHEVLGGKKTFYKKIRRKLREYLSMLFCIE